MSCMPSHVPITTILYSVCMHKCLAEKLRKHYRAVLEPCYKFHLLFFELEGHISLPHSHPGGCLFGLTGLSPTEYCYATTLTGPKLKFLMNPVLYKDCWLKYNLFPKILTVPQTSPPSKLISLLHTHLYSVTNCILEIMKVLCPQYN